MSENVSTSSKQNIKIIVDSAQDIPREIADQLGIRVLPLGITLQDQNGETHGYFDGDISPEEFYDRLMAGEKPGTSGVGTGQWQIAIEEELANGFDHVICITLHSAFGDTHQFARKAAESFGDQVTVLDTQSVSMGSGMQSIHAALQVGQGASVEEIVTEFEARKGLVHVLAGFNDVDYLNDGGHVGSVASSEMIVRPIFAIGGASILAEMAKTRKRSDVINKLSELVPTNAESVWVCHGAAPDADKFVNRLAERIPTQHVSSTILGPVGGTNAGPHVLGVAFIEPLGLEPPSPISA